MLGREGLTYSILNGLDSFSPGLDRRSFVPRRSYPGKSTEMTPPTLKDCQESRRPYAHKWGKPAKTNCLLDGGSGREEAARPKTEL